MKSEGALKVALFSDKNKSEITPGFIKNNILKNKRNNTKVNSIF